MSSPAGSPLKRLDRFFKLSEHKTSVRTEILAGITTFVTMAYIIVLQPMVLSGRMFGTDTGMNFESVTVATCLAAAVATAIMALYARYPIAQAPGMGENFVFVGSLLTAAGGLAAVKSGATTAWQVGMGVVFIAGVLFLILSMVGIRGAIINAISPSMKHGIAVGIGIFIAFIGLHGAGVVLKDPRTLVTLNTDFSSLDLIVFFFGLLLTAVLYARKVRGAIILGILGATILAVILKLLPLAETDMMKNLNLTWEIVGRPPSLGPTFFKFDLRHALTGAMIPFIVIFLFMDVFDTIGTLVGVGERAGLIKDNKLVRGRRAMLSDAVGTVTGACLGTSTVTSFIESAAGVEEGGRTGLTALTTAALFLVALFFVPLAAMVGSYPPITAPALVIVGAIMIRSVTKIEWDDYSESLPAFLVMLGIPFFHSIADGLALGFIAYPVIKLCSGKVKEVGWLTYALGGVLLLYFLFIR